MGLRIKLSGRIRGTGCEARAEFIYGFLQSSGGPRARTTYEAFGVQGVTVSLEHEFSCGAIDFRGMYKVPAY